MEPGGKVRREEKEHSPSQKVSYLVCIPSPQYKFLRQIGIESKVFFFFNYFTY